MINQQGQLVNVQRPHQIQPPGQHPRLVPGQILQANQQHGGQPVQIRIQGEPINIPHAELANMGQRLPPNQMGQQMQPQQQQQNMMQQQMRPQQQQMMNQNQNQAHQNPNQQQHQMINSNQNQNQHEQMMGNMNPNQQQQMRMGQQRPPHPQQHQSMAPQQQQQMAMHQQNRQNMNGPPSQQQQQRMQPSNMQPNQQQHQRMSGPPMPQGQQQHHPQQQQQQRMQNTVIQQNQQQSQQQNQQQQKVPTPNHNQQMRHGGQGVPQQPPQQQQQQMRMQQSHQMNMQQRQNMNNAPQGQQQMQQGPHGMNGPPQQQMRMQPPHMDQQQHQQQSQGQMQQNPQQHQMNGPQGHPQQMQQNQRMQGPPHQQQMRMNQQQDQMHPGQQNGPHQQQQQIQQGQQMRPPPPQQGRGQVNQGFPMQQPNQQNQQQTNQQQMPQQAQQMRGPMQNSPQPMRIVPQSQQNAQQQGQSVQQGRAGPQQGRPMQVFPNQIRPQQPTRTMQPIAPASTQQQNDQQQMQQQPHQQQQQQHIMVDQQDNPQTVRINGDQAIINGTQYRLMQVDQNSQHQQVDISQLQLVTAGPVTVSEANQQPQMLQMQQNDNGFPQQQQQQMQRPPLQQRPSSHQLIPVNVSQSPQLGHQIQNRQMMQQQQQPIMQNSPQNQTQPQSTPPTKPPPKPRNRSRKNNNQEQQQQSSQNQNPQTPNMQAASGSGNTQQMMHQNVDSPNNQKPMGMANKQMGQQNQRGPSRQMAPPNLTPLSGQAGPSSSGGMRNDQNYTQNQSHTMTPPEKQVAHDGHTQDSHENISTSRIMSTTQKRQMQGRPGTNTPSSSTSQPSTSQQKPQGQMEMTAIKDAIVAHMSGERTMTPEYVTYVCAELTRILNEMEKVGLSENKRYASAQKLLALLSGENPDRVLTPTRPKFAFPQPPIDKPIEDIPQNETLEEQKKIMESSMEVLKNAYPIKKWDVKFPKISDDLIRKEAAFYMKQDMLARANYLKDNLENLPEEKRTKAKIEYLGLNLIELQEKVRKEVAATLVSEKPTEFLINPWSIRRSKSEYAQELKEHPDRAILEKKRRITNNLLLHTLSKHTREFKEFHKATLAKHTKVRKAMQTQITNEAKKKTREEMKNEKLRIQKLIQEDEEGYRAMLDDKKDQRLVYLLEQTDGYIESLCGLLKQQKASTEAPTRIGAPKESNGLVNGAKAKNVLEKARNDNDEYEEDKTTLNFEDYYTTAHGIREEIKEQHYTMGNGEEHLRLKPYQIKGLEWMVSLYNNNLNGILADEMGLGKTIQTISFITYLMEKKKNSGPYLVIVPLSTIPNWQNEFEKWASHVELIVYKGTKEVRKAAEPIIKSAKFNVLLTTFEYVIREKALLGKLRWKYMIIDEGHRLKNQHCKLTEMLNTRFQCPRRLLITGTPLQNNLPELWALLNFLLPSIFSSCSSFEQWFNAPFATTGEKVELTQEETMLIIRRLHKVLRPFLLRRLKKEVESELPDKMEFVIKCEMSALQKVLYKHMQKGLLLDGKQNSGSRSLMNSMVHMRKLCNHPFLFNNVEDSCRAFWDVKYISGVDLYRVSGKLELLDRILPKLQATGHRVLMFFQMTSMMTIVEDYLAIKSINYLRLDGSTKPDERGMLLDKFNAPNSKYFLFMLSTRAGGLGLNLQTADTVIIFDSDWNPHQDMQAQDRAHRIGQKAEVRVFRLITANSVEEKILASAKFKLNVDEKVIQAGKFDNRSTGAERKMILEQIIKAENEEEEDDDLPNDEEINSMLARKDNEFEIFQKMDQDRYDHDRVNGVKPRLVGDNEIPKDILRAADETEYQEKAKEEGRVPYLEVMPGSRRKRKEVNYCTDTMSDEKFLETLLDGEDPTLVRPDSEEREPIIAKLEKVEKPEKAGSSELSASPLTFKVPRLTMKIGEEVKRKHKLSEGNDGSDSPLKQRKGDDEHRKEKHRKRKHEVETPIEKIKLRLSLGEPVEKLMKTGESTPKKPVENDLEIVDIITPKKKKHRTEDEGGSSEKKKKKHKHKRRDDMANDESFVSSADVSTSSINTSSVSENPPLKLKLNVRFGSDKVLDIIPRDSEKTDKSELKKKARENETEEERLARKAAKKEKKRLEALNDEARAEAKRIRKEQKRLEKEKLNASGSTNTAAGSAQL